MGVRLGYHRVRQHLHSLGVQGPSWPASPLPWPERVQSLASVREALGHEHLLRQLAGEKDRERVTLKKQLAEGSSSRVCVGGRDPQPVLLLVFGALPPVLHHHHGGVRPLLLHRHAHGRAGGEQRTARRQHRGRQPGAEAGGAPAGDAPRGAVAGPAGAHTPRPPRTRDPARGEAAPAERPPRGPLGD